MMLGESSPAIACGSSDGPRISGAGIAKAGRISAAMQRECIVVKYE